MMMNLGVLALVAVSVLSAAAQTLLLNGSALERTFDGIGGLSGGGATSRFLPNYESPYIDEILDYLFLPNFAASLQILKVEIGGDTDSTEGSEASHMHSADDLNFYRGYEWNLMVEAKKRNPNIKLYGLTWGVPGWIGNGNVTNYYTDNNILYHINWLKGAKTVYNLDIDYIGVWNERMWNDEWIVNFRAALDSAGFQDTTIVAPDRDWGIGTDMLKNQTLMDAVGVIGAHYPGTYTGTDALKTNKKVWASEDYSTFANSVGGGCWARILNQNYVNGWMTSTISWNLIAAYYNNVPWANSGLMLANSPWSGHYDVLSPIWVSAHTTQFTQPGWIYLAHGSGVGHLPRGGSYVTLVPPGNTGDFSLIIETFTHDHSICVRPYLPEYNISAQTVTFQLAGGLKSNVPLYVWYTHLVINGTNTYFENVKTITPTNGQFTIDLDLDSVVTISTLTGQQKGSHPDPPPSAQFPDSYSDDFQSYPLYSEANYFDDQTGSWEIQKGFDGTLVMRQMVTEKPIYWCGESERPISLIGPFASSEMSLSIDAYIEGSGSVNVGARLQGGGCWNIYEGGYFVSVDNTGAWNFTYNNQIISEGNVTIDTTAWTRLGITANSSVVCVYINKVLLACSKNDADNDGFGSIGSGWNLAQFKNFEFQAEYLDCGVGSKIATGYCLPNQTNQQWDLNADGTIKSKSDPNTCIDLGPMDSGSKNYTIITAPCNPDSRTQSWVYDGYHIKSAAYPNGCMKSLNWMGACVAIELGTCDYSQGDYSQNWWYQSDTNNIVMGSNMMCLTAISSS